MSKRVFITGCFGFGNIGDEAILAAMVVHLREQRPDLQITATSATPQATAEMLGIQAVLWSDVFAMMEAVRAADLVIIGGGGIFNDYRGVDPAMFLTDNHWGITFYTAPAALAILFDKPVMLYAVGVGPLFSDCARLFTKFACEVAARVTVRDAGSGALLESLGVPKDRIAVTADAVFGMPAGNGAPELDGDAPRIAVALRPWSVGVDQKFWEQEIASGLDRFLGGHAGSVVFIPFQRLKGSPEDDTPVAMKVQSLMKNKDRTSVLTSDPPPQQILGLLKQCHLVIGMRLHSMILGMLSQIPVLALSYDEKVDQLMIRAGMQARTLNIRSLDEAGLSDAMERILGERTVASLEGFAEAARENARIAIEILDGGAPRRSVDSEILSVLSKGVQAKLLESRDLRQENKRFFHEFEHYQKLSLANGAKAEALAAQIAGFEAERTAWRDELSGLMGRMDDLLSRTAIAEARTKAGWDQALAEMRKSTEERNAWIAQQAAWREERAALIAAAKDLSEELASARSAAAKIELRAAERDRDHENFIAQLESQSTRRLREEGQIRAEEAARHSAMRSDLGERIASIEAEVAKHSRERASAEKELGEVRAAHRTLSDMFRRACDITQKTISGLDRFQLQFDSDLKTYRSQRAWKVMLGLRKAYTLLTRRGIAPFLRWTIALPFAGPGSLADAEVRFPNIWNYMPERLDAIALPDTAEFSSTAPAVRRLYDVVIFAIFDFEFRFQRPQQIAAQFARLGHRVFWVSPARFLPESHPEFYEAVPLRERIWEVRLRGVRPDLYGGQMTPQNADSYGQSLEGLYQDFHISESCAILQFPYWRQAGLKLRDRFGARVVYDCMDDWQNWTAEPRISAYNLAEESELVRECDVLAVSSQQFFNRHRAAGLRPLLVRNGADFEFFSIPRQNNLLADVVNPIVGYYGAIADWFDIELLIEVARSRPQYSFVIIGQVHEVDISTLRELPNVHLLGEKNYREIPQYLAHFDVCIIPFRLNSLTKAVDPVKLYEYLSQGKPVVATGMDELPKDVDLLYIAANAGDFAKKIDCGLAEADPARTRRRIEFAQSNTWSKRCQDLDRAIAASFPAFPSSLCFTTARNLSNLVSIRFSETPRGLTTKSCWWTIAPPIRVQRLLSATPGRTSASASCVRQRTLASPERTTLRPRRQAAIICCC